MTSVANEPPPPQSDMIRVATDEGEGEGEEEDEDEFTLGAMESRPRLQPSKPSVLRVGGKSFKISANGVLKDIDPDGDGVITSEELMSYVINNRLSEQEKKFVKRSLKASVIFLTVAVTVIVMLTFTIVWLLKDSAVDSNDKFVSTESGNEILVANSDVYVSSDGQLVGRANHSTSSDSSSNAIATRRALKPRQLVSTMPDAYFKELEWLEFQSPTTATLNLKILGIARVPSLHAKCGTYLKLVTAAGTIVLDDTDMYSDDSVGNVLVQAGFSPLSSSVASTSADAVIASQLGGVARGSPRRLQSSQVSVVGFFNRVDDLPWECSSVEAPVLNEVYSTTIHRYVSCIDQSTGADMCTYEFARGYDVTQFGTTTLNGLEYLVTESELIVTPTKSTLIASHPYTPGVEVVSQTDLEAGTTTQFQLDEEGVVSNCHITGGGVAKSSSNLTADIAPPPNDFIFYFRGLTGDSGQREFQVVESKEFGNTSISIKYSYFDDADSKLPTGIAMDNGNIIRFENYSFGESANLDIDQRYNISFDVLYSCELVTRQVLQGKFGQFDVTTEEGSLLKDAWNYSTPYPPSASHNQNGTAEYYHAAVCGASGGHADWCEWAEARFAEYETIKPTLPTPHPTSAPTDVPTFVPTAFPTNATGDPSLMPSPSPSDAPTAYPSLDLSGYSRRQLLSFDELSLEEQKDMIREYYDAVDEEEDKRMHPDRFAFMDRREEQAYHEVASLFDNKNRLKMPSKESLANDLVDSSDNDLQAYQSIHEFMDTEGVVTDEYVEQVYIEAVDRAAKQMYEALLKDLDETDSLAVGLKAIRKVHEVDEEAVYQGYAMKIMSSPMTATCETPNVYLDPKFTSTEFNLDTAIRSATLAGVAYNTTIPYSDVKFTGCVSGFQVTSTISDTSPLLPTIEGFIGYEDITVSGVLTRFVTVSIRGMEMLDDFDLRAFNEPLTYNDCGGCKVHAAAYRAALVIRAQVNAGVASAIGGSAHSVVVFTGHNMGGSIASLLALEYIKPAGSKQAHLYSFGSPRVGNREFVTHVETLTDLRVFRMTKYSDPVPYSFPPQFDEHDVMWAHMFGEVYEDGMGSLIRCNITQFEPVECLFSNGWFDLTSQAVYMNISMGIEVGRKFYHEYANECNIGLAPPVKQEGADFCWTGSYGRGAGTVPQSCPSGYYFFGGFCYKNCQPNYGTLTNSDLYCYHNCPSGYHDTGLFCNNPRPTLRGDQFSNPCPNSDYNQFGAGLCYHKHVTSLVRTEGVYWDSCPWGTWESWGSCWGCDYGCWWGGCCWASVRVWLHQRRHTYCDSGYTGPILGLCYAKSTGITCPPGYYNTGLLCQVKVNTPITSTCDINHCYNNAVGWSGDGINPIKPSYHRGLRMPDCPPDKEMDAGLCYPRCATGYNGVGPVCWSTCPDGYVSCGAGCAVDEARCAIVLADQIFSTFAMFASVADIFCPGTSAAVKAAGKATGKAIASGLKNAATKVFGGAVKAADGAKKVASSSSVRAALMRNYKSILSAPVTSVPRRIKLSKILTLARKQAYFSYEYIASGNDSPGPEQVLRIASMANTGMSMLTAIPGLSMISSALGAAFAFAAPICNSDAFWSWKAPLNSKSPVLSSNLSEYCKNDSFFAPTADFFQLGENAVPFQTFTDVGSRTFEIVSIRKTSTTGHDLCLTYTAWDAPIYLRPCGTPQSQFKYKYNPSGSSVLRDESLLAINPTDTALQAVVNNPGACLTTLSDNTLTLSQCAADLKKFKFLPLFNDDNSLLIRSSLYWDDMCIDDVGFDDRYGDNGKVALDACNPENVDQWFKLRVLS